MDDYGTKIDLIFNLIWDMKIISRWSYKNAIKILESLESCIVFDWLFGNIKIYINTYLKYQIVIGRLMPSKDVNVPIPGTCEFVDSHSKRDFADVT